MNLITRQGRALLAVAAAVVVAVVLLGCGGNKDASSTEKSGQGSVSKKTGTFTDKRDGQKYRSVKIGNQVWMAENLRFKIGDSRCYDNDESKCQQYGRLYNWNTAKSACPAGWHLPSKAEWDALENAAGGNVAGKKLKAKSGWNNKGNGTDDYGFSALSGGYRRTGGSFGYAGHVGYWWTAAEYGSGSAYNRSMYYDNGFVGENCSDKDLGFSVRCVSDN